MIHTTHPYGRHGFEIIDNADGEVTGPFYALEADGGAATFAATAVQGKGVNLPSAERGEGITVMGRFQTATCTVGQIRAYPEEEFTP